MPREKTSNPKVFKDKSGKVLKAGDYIIYGHAIGRCAGLKYGKVVGIKPGNPNSYSQSSTTLRVQGLEDNQWNDEISLSRKSTLQFQERVLKIERSQLPEESARLLDTVPIEGAEKELTGKANRLEEVD
jgi:hypothetical protein